MYVCVYIQEVGRCVASEIRLQAFKQLPEGINQHIGSRLDVMSGDYNNLACDRRGIKQTKKKNKHKNIKNGIPYYLQ